MNIDINPNDPGAPLDPLPGHSSRGRLERVLRRGEFAVTAELNPPDSADPHDVYERASVFEELKTTIHYSNRSGVRATCPDCHVPHNWTDKIARKMQASKEVWGKIFGTINTREKFLDERLILATHEWNRLKANDSLECRNCHDYDSMDLTRQGSRAAQVHKLWLGTGKKTCIDCHKGVAHRLPDMTGVPQG